MIIGLTGTAFAGKDTAGLYDKGVLAKIAAAGIPVLREFFGEQLGQRLAAKNHADKVGAHRDDPAHLDLAQPQIVTPAPRPNPKPQAAPSAAASAKPLSRPPAAASAPRPAAGAP